MPPRAAFRNFHDSGGTQLAYPAAGSDVVKVATLKDQAREYERQGDVQKALAIYRHILTHLEGTPAIKGQLPLYVKVGDLQLKQGDPEGAIGMYERAAEHYAEHGSAKSVIALCLKILRVAPKHTTVYLNYARHLLDNDHVGAARDVLADFAERASLVKPLETLQRLADRPSEEVRPVLARMLAGVKQPAGATIQPKPEAPPVVPDAPQPSQPEPPAPAVFDRPSREADRLDGFPAEASEPDAYAPVDGAGDEDEAESTAGAVSFEAPSEADGADAPGANGVSAAPVEGLQSAPPWGVPERDETVADESPPAEEQPLLMASPGAGKAVGGPTSGKRRQPFSSFVDDAERRRSGSRIWLFLSIIVILAALAGAFVKLGVIPMDLRWMGWGDAAQGRLPENATTGIPSTSGGDVPAVVPRSVSADSVDDSLRVPSDNASVGDASATDSLPSVQTPDRMPSSTPPVARGAAPGAVDAAAGRRDPPAAVELARPPVMATPRVPGWVEATGPVILVAGLGVDSVAEFASGELVGVRIIHRLDTGDQLILRAVPVAGQMGDTVTAGTPRVTMLRGDTAFGTVMFAGYLVNAKGKIPAERLDRLLRQLVRVRP